MAATEGPVAANPRLRTARIDVASEARSYVSGDQRITSVPLSIRRRQNRKLLTPPAGEVSALGAGGLDVPMIKTLGKAFYWKSLLDEGRYASSNALARMSKLEPGSVAEVLRLTMLAPDIVESILDGSQPRHLDLQTLRGRHDLLPRDWEQQREGFGIAVRGPFHFGQDLSFDDTACECLAQTKRPAALCD
jgi:hypothetical protein